METKLTVATGSADFCATITALLPEPDEYWDITGNSVLGDDFHCAIDACGDDGVSAGHEDFDLTVNRPGAIKRSWPSDQ